MNEIGMVECARWLVIMIEGKVGFQSSYNRFNWQTFQEVIKPKCCRTTDSKFYSFPLTIFIIDTKWFE